MITNKKGQGFETEQLRMISYAGGLLFVAVILVLVFAQSVRVDIDTSEIEKHSTVYRLFNSENCLGVADGILNLNNFDEVRLNECFDSSNGVELKLSYLNESKIVEVNKQMVSQKIVCGLKKSGYDCYDTRKFVLVSGNFGIEKAILDIKVVVNV
ncbi:hypothetical protein HN865_02495 [Candidatus Woesearchaeota archaeon]|jgi:hypothetical protein|nr:hypothetical protein [Cryomorphaceae bacterium]MBT7237704.1 hypothetical protein [Candidatus Woesearchaeota archaeon]